MSSDVYRIDSLGCGLSSRPRWHLGKGENCAVEDAENFFVDGLERWRDAMQLEKMVLMGHSVGGYLAVAYAEKYPERVEVAAAGLEPMHPCGPGHASRRHVLGSHLQLS